MKVACPICWHSVVTLITCQNCSLIQCLEYEGPMCINCGGICKLNITPKTVEETQEATPEPAVAG